jgi:hypothetical protein
MEHKQRSYSPMEEPWPRIIRNESYGHVIPSSTHTYCVSPDWVDEVRCTVTRNSYNGKIVLSSALELTISRRKDSGLTP